MGTSKDCSRHIRRVYEKLAPKFHVSLSSRIAEKSEALNPVKIIRYKSSLL